MSSATAPIERKARGVDIVGRHRGLGRRTLLVSGLTLLSRLLGFVREVLSAMLFGDTSGVFDAFITAWRVPNLFRRFLGEGALSTSLQTAITEVDGDRGEEAGRALFLATLRILFWILIATSAIVMAGVALLPDTLPFTDFAWLGDHPGPVRELTFRVMPFVVLICLSAAVGGALQVRGHFAAPAWAPAVFNVVWILTLVLIGLVFGWSVGQAEHREMTRMLAWGVLAAGLVQLLVQVPALKRTRLLAGRGRAWSRTQEARRGALRVLRNSAPLALGAAAYQVNVMIDGLMAEGLLEDGGPTLHYYANRLQQFPMALIAVAATSAVFPALKALGHQREHGALRALYDRTQLAISYVALPATVGLFVLAEAVVSVSFERGAFGAAGVVRTTDALRALCFAILPAGAVGLVARTYYSLGDFRTPVVVSTFALVVNVGLNALFILSFGMDVEGLAWATAATSWGNLVALLVGLSRSRSLPRGDVRYLPRLALQGAAAAVSGLCAWGTLTLVTDGRATGPGLGLSIVAGAVGFVVSSAVLGLPEWRAVKARVFGFGKG